LEKHFELNEIYNLNNFEEEEEDSLENEVFDNFEKFNQMNNNLMIHEYDLNHSKKIFKFKDSQNNSIIPKIEFETKKQKNIKKKENSKNNYLEFDDIVVNKSDTSDILFLKKFSSQ
jgi:hypothetical protein